MNDDEISRLRSLLGSALSSIDDSQEKANAVLSDLLRAILQLRRIRNNCFPEGYFADTAWDILLDLYEARTENRLLCTTSLAVDSKTPLATVLRYLKKLEDDGFIIRYRDSVDRRRTMVELTDQGEKVMGRVFSKTVFSGLGELAAQDSAAERVAKIALTK